jgi:hypothetical protein
MQIVWWCLLLVVSAQPSLDDLWEGKATFAPHATFAEKSLPNFSVGTQVFPVGPIWYLFNRQFSPPTNYCTQGVYSIYVRASNNQGVSWSAPYPVAVPNQASGVCQYVDGSPFYDNATATWHYLSQQLDAGGKGGWSLAHFYLPHVSPVGQWITDPNNPVVKGGQLWSSICAGPNKHCKVGTIDEGTPQIVEKRSDGNFVITFHGYDYQANRGVRGVALTKDFLNWMTIGDGLPGDAIYSRDDCMTWKMSWAPGGCIGSGAASVLVSNKTGYLYMMIEAADVSLVCLLQPNQQWWPFGLVRSTSWAASPQWQNINPANPFLLGPHVGCTLQYNAFWRDQFGYTYWAFWSLNVQKGQLLCQTWYIYKLQWGTTPKLPLSAPVPTC